MKLVTLLLHFWLNYYDGWLSKIVSILSVKTSGLKYLPLSIPEFQQNVVDFVKSGTYRKPKCKVSENEDNIFWPYYK